MAEFQAGMPDKYTLGDSWGLGWIRFGWDGQRLIGHDGNTIGQSAFLRLLPAEGLAAVLLTNGGNVRDLYQDLFQEIFSQTAEVRMPSPLTPPATPATADVHRHAGVYERASPDLFLVREADGGSWLPVTFYELPGGEKYLHFSVRATPKAG